MDVGASDDLDHRISRRARIRHRRTTPRRESEMNVISNIPGGSERYARCIQTDSFPTLTSSA